MTNFIFFVFNGAHLCGNGQSDLRGRSLSDIQPHGAVRCGSISRVMSVAQLNNLGKMVSKQWNDLPNRFPNIALDQFIVMPNHIHGIVQLVGAPLAGARIPNAVSRNNYYYDVGRPWIMTGGTADNDRATARVAPTVGNIFVRINRYAFKIVCNGLNPIIRHSIWVNYGNAIIGNIFVRNENELNRIRDYIRHNPQKWGMDKLGK